MGREALGKMKHGGLWSLQAQQGSTHPCVKVPDPRTFTILHRSTGNTRAGEGGLGTWAWGSHTHSNGANSMPTAAALTLSKDGGCFLDLTRERTKSPPSITRKTSGKLRLRHLSTIQRKKNPWQTHIFWHVIFHLHKPQATQTSYSHSCLFHYP